MKKQLIVVADMEGASGIFESNRSACWHEELHPDHTLWRTYGRKCITSDVLAVCNAAVDSGIEDILLYDEHFAGCEEFNVELDKLPEQVRVFDLPKRCAFMSRIRGQAAVSIYTHLTKYKEEQAIHVLDKHLNERNNELQKPLLRVL